MRRVRSDVELVRGQHIHTSNHANGEVCEGNDPECPLWLLQLSEAMEAWSGS